MGKALQSRQWDSLFDEKPIKLHGFTLGPRSVEIVGKPTLAQYTAALDFAVGSHESSPYWVGAIVNYGEGRADWRGKLEQAVRSQSAQTRKTLSNLACIVRNVAPEALELAPSITHASEVVSLEPDEQVEWMDKARTDGMTVRDLRLGIRSAARRVVLNGQADTMHTVEVVVQLSVEAQTKYAAEQSAWETVKQALSQIAGAKVIAAGAK